VQRKKSKNSLNQDFLDYKINRIVKNLANLENLMKILVQNKNIKKIYVHLQV